MQLYLKLQTWRTLYCQYIIKWTTQLKLSEKLDNRARDAKVGKFSKKIGNLSVKVSESLKKEKLDQAIKYQTKIKKFQKEIDKLYNKKLYWPAM